MPALAYPEISKTWKPFVSKAKAFLEKTREYALHGVSPGGYYEAIWCRDASYILRDWFLSANVDETLLQLSQIWSHQITPGGEKIVYGRGSPEMGFSQRGQTMIKKRNLKGLFLLRYIRLVSLKYMARILTSILPL